jgi:hypothetical protein
MNLRLLVAGSLLCFFASAVPLHAEEPVAGDVCGPEFSAACLAHEARTSEKPGDAIAILKEATRRYPDHAELLLLLAKAYLADDNDFWALRVLSGWLARHPDDCEAALWLSWVYLRQGSLDDARLANEEAACPDQGPLAARRHLLKAMIERHADASESARQALNDAYQAPDAYQEDREAIAFLKPELDPWHVQPLSWRLELWGGWTSNAQAGSPQDAAQTSYPQSAFGNFSAWLNFTPNFNFWLHPSLEGDVRMLGYAAENGRDYSYLLLSGRPGLLFGGSRWSVLAAYRYESLLLAGGDRYAEGPLWFYQAHRAEIEASPLPWLTLFSGAGQRQFREMGRTRIEVDGGVGGGYRVLKDLKVMGALSGRWQNANNDAYDLYGGSLLLSLEYVLPYGLSLRGGLSAGVEYYPRSTGYFDPLKPDVERRDVLVKPTAGFWSPAWSGFRAGLVYEFAERFSTAKPYDYTDHRVIVKFVWPFSLDPWLPKASAPEDHVPLDWGLHAGDGGGERIQDLLRQDEAVQRGSSCVE